MRIALVLVLAMGGMLLADDKDIDLVAQGNNAFAADLYARLSAKEGNLFFSPYSISSALAMTWAGARANTEKEMAQALHFGLPQDRLHAAMGALMADLNGRKMEKRCDGDPDAGRKTIELVVANALWSQKGYPFRQEYFDRVSKAYGAGLTELDMAKDTEAARLRINGWVEEKTNERIQDLIAKGQLTADTRLVLTNAIYFKAAWSEPFRRDCTKEEEFHLAAGGATKVQMMHGGGDFGYLEGDGFEAVDVPYLGGDTSMLILLPKKADGLPALEKQATGENLAAWTGKMGSQRVSLGLPRFKTTCAFELGSELQALGMKDAFHHPAADFTGMSDTKELYIAFVIHKAFVDVNEEGTEAAAATAVTMTKRGAPRDPKKLLADHPFLFLIRDRKTEAILFMGRVMDPRG